LALRIVTDSTCDLPGHLISEHDIEVVPIHVIWGKESFRDGVDICSRDFFERLQARDDLPTTSQPAVGDFATVYSRLVEKGDSVISIHLSSKLSGTYTSALMAKDLVGGDIHVVDSQNISLGLGFQVLEAARAAVTGSKNEVFRAISSTMHSMRFMCALRTLEYLRKGGRIADMSAFIGTLLNIKPLLSVEKGLLVSTERARGFQQALARMIDSVTSSLPRGARHVVGVIHAAARETAERLQEELVNRLRPLEVYLTETGPALGTHAGPGAVGIAAYSK
jgi:DegV family protein with EDD domain